MLLLWVLSEPLVLLVLAVLLLAQLLPVVL
jgi:hypothetical protein